MSNLVHNERIKYAATVFNNTGVASFLAGVVIPMFSTDLSVEAHYNVYLFTGIGMGLLLLFSAWAALSHLRE
jgi:hypothetical protein